MATLKKSASNPAVDLYDRLIATMPKLERKGAANPYTSLNGNMFTLLRSIEDVSDSPSGRRTRVVYQEA